VGGLAGPSQGMGATAAVHPNLVGQVRYFHNLRAAANDITVDLIEAHIPKDVQERDFHDNTYCFTYLEVEVQIEASEDSA
jgi:hypothetical protein